MENKFVFYCYIHSFISGEIESKLKENKLEFKISSVVDNDEIKGLYLQEASFRNNVECALKIITDLYR